MFFRLLSLFRQGLDYFCTGSPDSLQENLARDLILVSYVEGAFIAGCELADGYTNLTNFIIIVVVFVENYDCEFFSSVVNGHLERLIPLGLLASSLQHLGLELVIPKCDSRVGIHLSEGISVTGQVCRYDSELEDTASAKSLRD